MAAKQKQKSPSYHYDAIVIGTGPGGEGVAMQLAKAGKKVAVVERYEAVGGGCTHWEPSPRKRFVIQLAGSLSTTHRLCLPITI